MNHSQSFALLNQTTQATKKLKRKRLEAQVKDLLEPVALNAVIAIEDCWFEQFDIIKFRK